MIEKYLGVQSDLKMYGQNVRLKNVWKRGYLHIKKRCQAVMHLLKTFIRKATNDCH